MINSTAYLHDVLAVLKKVAIQVSHVSDCFI